MAAEHLSVKESEVMELVQVIREGLMHVEVDVDLAARLDRWCDAMEEEYA